jgi:hypothetical protein
MKFHTGDFVRVRFSRKYGKIVNTHGKNHFVSIFSKSDGLGIWFRRSDLEKVSEEEIFANEVVEG